MVTCTHGQIMPKHPIWCASPTVTRLKHDHPSIQETGLAINSSSRPSAARRQQLTRFESDGNSGSHAPDSHATSPARITPRIQMVDKIH